MVRGVGKYPGVWPKIPVFCRKYQFLTKNPGFWPKIQVLCLKSGFEFKKLNFEPGNTGLNSKSLLSCVSVGSQTIRHAAPMYGVWKSIQIPVIFHRCSYKPPSRFVKVHTVVHTTPNWTVFRNQYISQSNCIFGSKIPFFLELNPGFWGSKSRFLD